MVSSRFITNHKTTKKHLKKNGFVFGLLAEVEVGQNNKSVYQTFWKILINNF